MDLGTQILSGISVARGRGPAAPERFGRRPRTLRSLGCRSRCKADSAASQLRVGGAGRALGTLFLLCDLGVARLAAAHDGHGSPSPLVPSCPEEQRLGSTPVLQQSSTVHPQSGCQAASESCSQPAAVVFLHGSGDSGEGWLVLTATGSGGRNSGLYLVPVAYLHCFWSGKVENIPSSC